MKNGSLLFPLNPLICSSTWRFIFTIVVSVKNLQAYIIVFVILFEAANYLFFTESREDGPVISGGKKEYQVGEIVDVNCTASKSQPPAELQWYINDKEVTNIKLFIYFKVNIGNKNPYLSN